MQSLSTFLARNRRLLPLSATIILFFIAFGLGTAYLPGMRDSQVFFNLFNQTPNLLCPMSPLVIDEAYTDAYLETVGYDIPAVVMPMPLRQTGGQHLCKTGQSLGLVIGGWHATGD